jgi:murein DD-endopeptidase MepM/ murein hydrolase activator NlpD
MRPSFARKGFFKSSYLVSAAAAVMLGACSSDMDRFADNPSDSDPVYTASVPKDDQTQAEDNSVTSRPLAGASVKPRAPGYASNAYNYQQSYKQPAYKAPSYDEPAPQQRVAAVKPVTAVPARDGHVTVEPGMTLYSIAKANGVPVRTVAQANGITPPYAVHVGQTLRIPGVAHAEAPSPSFNPNSHATAQAEAPKRQQVSPGGAHTVASGDTLYSLSRKYGVSPRAIADLNRLPPNATLSLGQNIRIPSGGSKVVAQAPAAPAESESQQTAEQATPAAATPKPETAASTVPAPTDQASAKDQTSVEPEADEPQQAAADPSLPGMRWPVKGKIISAYGSKPNGLRNEGINIAVPEGTGIRAADGGVVAYAGNELKGYGNLVLIRHDGGWVTAYAHNKELIVKRGDTVKRGDIVAKAGQTGSVTSPQLHFEVRKGATAMDPIRFLGSATAAN